jgi:cation transport ATPase
LAWTRSNRAIASGAKRRRRSVDGAVGNGLAVLDQSALTGESIPVQHAAARRSHERIDECRRAFDLIASRRAAESTYAGIVRLVEAAQRSKAPMSRLADRIALAFLGLTVVIAGGAWLSTATRFAPSPFWSSPRLPAHSGGRWRSSRDFRARPNTGSDQRRQGTGGPSAHRSVVIDKTGTLTEGRARVVAMRSAPGLSADDLLASPPRSIRLPSTSSRRLS